MKITDPSGHLLSRLRGGSDGAGVGNVLWDGRDDAGRPAPNGITFVRIRGTAGSA